jgi:hypothetical protein
MELTYEATATETSAPDVVELALIGKPNALALFQPNGLDQILDKIRSEVALHVPDISTERGRKAIGSLARKVASSKVRLDDLGKELVCEVKAQVGQIDAERKRMRDELDQLRDDTRRPLTEWEDVEKSRVQAHEDAINEMLNIVPMDTLEGINQQVQRVESFASRNWQEFKARYGRAMDQAMARLNDRATAIRIQAEERAELARLQKLEAERLQLEREERIKAQAAAEAKAAAEARALEEAAKAERAANAERERIQQEKDEAEARAKRAEAARVEAVEAAIREAEETAARVERARLAEETRQRKEAARVEYERIEAEAAREAAEKRHAEELAAAERKAEADKQAAIEAERRRVAEAQRIEERAAAKREANKKHRASINRAAVTALVTSAGITEEMAILVVTAIAHGKVPNVSISY